MRTSVLSPVSRLATVGAVVLAAVVTVTTTGTGPVEATGGPTWWVATSGTPDGSASSCADPDAVGTTHVAIQSILDQAADGDTVHLCAGTYAIGTTLTVAQDITIIGEGVAATILDGGSTTRIMEIASTVTPTTGVAIDSIQFRNGRATRGGAISAGPDSKLTIVDSMFRNNVAADNDPEANEHGGAIDMAGNINATGSLHVVGSTFLDNRAQDDGGAISTGGMGWPGQGHPDSTITNSTFVDNVAGRQGGAVNSTFGTTRVSHSTFLDNDARVGDRSTLTAEELADGGAATYKSFVSNSLIASSTPSTVGLCAASDPTNELTSNVTTDASCNGSGGSVSTAADLELTFVAPWGGATPTVAIGSGSDAIGVITANCPATDQRGEVRGAAPCDAGAFEYVSGAAALTPNRIELEMLAGEPLENYTLPVASGLTSPTYRLATEVSPALPAGVSLSTSTGRLSGTPTENTTASAFVITATDGNGAVANLRIDVDVCPMAQDQSGVFLISSRSELGGFQDGVCGLDSDYRLTTDVAWNASWTSVGSPAAPFTGTFDGDGHTITGLEITGGDFSAFIRRAIGATVSALTFSADVEGGYGSAGLVGYSDRTNILDVHGSVTFSAQNGGAGCTGALVGEFYTDGTITDSSATGTLYDPDGDWVGGLVGCAGPAIVARSSFSGSVTGRVSVGGLIGWMGDTKIVDSFAVGHVTGSAQVGGLVGEQLDGGPASDPIAVVNSYVGVALYGSNVTTGGLVGFGESTAVEASFWEAGLATSGALTAIGAASDLGNTPTGSAATDPADLRSHGILDAAGWAVVDGWVDPATTSDVWGVCELMGLPFHLHRHSTNPCVVAPEPPAEPSIPPLPAALVDMTGQPAQSAGPSTTVPTTTVPSAPTSPPTTVPPTVPGSVPDPVLSAGESAVFVDGRAVATETTWTVDGSLTVRIGDAEVGMGFEPNAAVSGPLGRLRQGRPLRLRLTGLRPGSVVTATLFSTPMPLGSVTADQSGVVDASLTVPDNAPAGRHRLRLEVIDREGRAIEVWAGVEVDPGSVQLPATGRSAPVVPALMLLLAGAITLGGTRRRRHMTAV